MTPERAVELLSELSFDSVRLSVTKLEPNGRATVVLSIYQQGELVMEKSQPVRILPTDAAIVIDEARFRAFAGGIARALRRCDLECVMPCDLIVANLLRVPSLNTPEDFAACLEDRSLRRSALADLEVIDYARDHDLAPPANAAVRTALWTLIHSDGDVQEALDAAGALVAADAVDAIALILTMLEVWQARMWETGGISWVTDDDRNVDVMLSRVLEPLLRKGSAAELRRLEALEVIGMFDAEHVTARYEWMFKT